MKVLHVQREVPHYKKAFIQELSSSKGFSYTLALLSSSLGKKYAGALSAEEFKSAGINCVEIEGKIIRLLNRRIEVYPALLGHIIRNRPDVILEGGISFFGSIYIDACIFYVLKWVARVRYTGGCSGSAMPDRGALYGLLRRIKHKLVFGYFDSYATYGEKSKDVLIACGVRERDIFVAYNSLDTTSLEAVRQDLLASERAWKDDLRQNLGIYENDKIILFLSRITPQKRLDLMIKAFPLIVRAEPAARLLIVGDGDARDYCISLAEKSAAADRIVFARGVYDDMKVAKFFLLSDVVVFPGWISLSTHFAMVMGKPFVCVPNGNEVEYALDKKNCFLFKAGDADDMAEKVITLLKDPALRFRCGEVSRELVATKANIDNKVAGYRRAIEYAYHS